MLIYLHKMFCVWKYYLKFNKCSHIICIQLIKVNMQWLNQVTRAFSFWLDEKKNKEMKKMWGEVGENTGKMRKDWENALIILLWICKIWVNFLKNRYFANNLLIKDWIWEFFFTHVIHKIVIIRAQQRTSLDFNEKQPKDIEGG